jgi:5-methylcytosine-specific restriction protein B
MIKEEFSWVETHKQLTEFLKRKENSQNELIQILKTVGIGPLNDKSGDGEHDTELKEIDPFTFFCYIYKYGPKRRLGYLQKIAETLNITIPKGESGIPSAQAQKVWLFPYEFLRTNNEVKRLWSFFHKVISNSITEDDFQDVLQIRSTGKTKLTEALFYINPEKYLPINGPTKPYISDILGLNPKFNTYQDYIHLLENIKNKSTLPFYELSYEAWKWNNERKNVNYWIFQGNPKVFDFETALKENLLDDWTVSAHKDKIKVGDKVILWITGSRSGCYALAEVTSEPHVKSQSPDDHLWKEEDMSELKAGIKITHNLVEKPIFSKEIISIEELADLKVGNKGTNFLSNQEEFEIMLEMAENKTNKKYWLFSPGENAGKWDEFYNLSIMGLGWDELGDLNKLGDLNDITKAVQQTYQTDSKSYNNALANFEFRDVIMEGDIIIAKKGRGELLGYGIVKSQYIYDDSRTEYKHIRKVDWKLKGNWKVDFSLVLKTLTNITKYSSDHLDYDTYYDRLLGIMSEKVKQYKNIMKYPLNTIFYGPPGTGKTYNTVLRAAEIVENRTIDSYDEALQIFKSKLHDQIEFITFHQNYSYEDFIQGLRPDTENDGQLSFEKKDGVFLRMATEALFEYYKVSKKIKAEHKGNNEIKDANVIYLDFIDYLKGLKSKDFKSSTGAIISISSFTKNDNIEFKHVNSSRSYIVSSNRLLKLFQRFPDINQINNVHTDIRDAIGGCNTTVYWVALREFISFYNKYEQATDEEKEEVFEEVGYESKKKLLATYDLNLLQEIDTNAVSNYVIIIDEINRANISRVFGELITLIEPDKRSHGKIPLEARLPSGDSFIVPSNLFIIGTMNTADKSIALLDIALRRRFEFESMYPKYEIEGQEIYDVDILLKINEQIIKSKGHDFQIGHAYFMGENKDLVQRMNKKVIPLLLEYYMNDEKEVKGILQSAGLKIEENSWPIRIVGKND